MTPLEFSIAAGDASQLLEIAAWIAAATVIVFIAALWRFLKHSGVGPEERRQLRSIVPQLFRASPTTITISRSGGYASRRDDVRDVLTRGSNLEEAGEQTVRETIRAFGGDLRSVTPDAPKLAVRGVAEGFLILVFGATLFISAAWWERMFAWDGVGAAAVDTAAVVYHSAEWAIHVFPVPDEILIIGLTVALTVWDLMYSFWWLVGLVLIASSIGFAVIDRETEEDLAVTLYPDRKWFIGAILGFPLCIWATGVFAAATTTYLTDPGLGALIGFGTAAVATLLTAGYVLYDLSGRVTDRQEYPSENTRLVAAYLLVRRSLLITALVAFPLLLYIAGLAIGTGHVAHVLGIIISAPLITKVGLGIGVLGVTVYVLHQTEGGIGFLKAWRRLWRSTAIRGWMFASGIPASAMLLAFAGTWAFVGTQPVGHVTFVSALLGLWPPLVAAILVGVIVRSWTLAWSALRYRFIDLWSTRDEIKYHVGVACYPELEDADGDPIYHARVFGRDLGHRNPGCLIRDIERVIEALFHAEKPPATMSEYYWDDVKRGTVDIEQTKRELRGDVLTRIRATFRANGGEFSDTVVDEELADDYPREAIDATMETLYESSDVSHRDGKYIHHGQSRGGALPWPLPLGLPFEDRLRQ